LSCPDRSWSDFKATNAGNPSSGEPSRPAHTDVSQLPLGFVIRSENNQRKAARGTDEVEPGKGLFLTPALSLTLIVGYNEFLEAR